MNTTPPSFFRGRRLRRSLALRTMLRIRNWSVVERGALRIGRSYNAALRFRLDVAELPKPLQVSALGRKDWSLGSDWYRWTFAAGRDAR